MSYTTNPNKTTKIENAWDKELKQRFKKVKSDMLAIPLSSVTANATASQQQAIDLFMEKMTETAIGTLISAPWQNKYQTQSYERGIERATKELSSILSAQEAAQVGTLNIEAAALIQTAVHSNELAFLHQRANEKLSKWVDELLFDTRSILHEQMGIVSVDDIHTAITDRINVTTSRARVIEVTEIAQASQRAVLVENEQSNSMLDSEITLPVWITVRDSHVRALHARWHGVTMSNEQAARNITISPWRCRCGFKLARKDGQPARLTARYKKEREELLRL